MRDLQIPACLDEIYDALQNIIALPVPYQDSFSDFGIFRKLIICLIFPVGFGVWEGLQSMGNAAELQMDGFSIRFESSESISVDFRDFGYMGVDSGGLTLFPKGLRTV